MMSINRILWLFSLALLLSSCALLTRNIEKPTARVKEFVVQEMSASGIELLFDIEVQNPNSFGLKLDGLKYDVNLAGRQLTSGHMDTGVQLPANGSALVKVPLNMNYADVFASAGELLTKRTVPYEITGSVNVGFLNVPFSRSGKVDLK